MPGVSGRYPIIPPKEEISSLRLFFLQIVPSMPLELAWAFPTS